MRSRVKCSRGASAPSAPRKCRRRDKVPLLRELDERADRIADGFHIGHSDGAGAGALRSAGVVIFDGCPSWRAWFWSYVLASLLSVVLIGLLWLLFIELGRRSRRLRITERTIDYDVGLFSSSN